MTIPRVNADSFSHLTKPLCILENGRSVLLKAGRQLKMIVGSGCNLFGEVHKFTIKVRFR